MKGSQKNTQTEILACPRGLHESGDTQEITHGPRRPFF